MHYATTDFNKSPIRVASISITEFDLKLIKSFTIKNKSKDEEIRILKEFFEYLNSHLNHTIISWNQNKPKYGPIQIITRCKELEIENGLKDHLKKFVDLDQIFEEKFGKKYATHEKLETLARKNGLQTSDFKTGVQQILDLNLKKYQSLENSINRKVIIIFELLDLAFKDKLVFERHIFRNIKTYLLDFKLSIPMIISIISLITAISHR